jgi:hypothetical protein
MTGAMKLRHHLFTALLLLIFAAGSQSAMAEDTFLSAIEDLPLMDGLNEVEGVGVTFDSPSGRIVEALTMGKVDKNDVSTFYSQTLPQLGWTETAPHQFSREGEILILEFPPTLAISGESSAPLSVRFKLSPAQ